MDVRDVVEKLSRAYFALTTLKQFNRLHNDLDAYLYEIADYGMGIRTDIPKKEDYGVTTE